MDPHPAKRLTFRVILHHLSLHRQFCCKRRRGFEPGSQTAQSWDWFTVPRRRVRLDQHMALRGSLADGSINFRHTWRRAPCVPSRTAHPNPIHRPQRQMLQAGAPTRCHPPRCVAEKLRSTEKSGCQRFVKSRNGGTNESNSKRGLHEGIWRAAPAVGHLHRETKPCPHASSEREGPVRILANEGDGTDELPENVGFQRHSRAQLSANSNAPIESFWGSLKSISKYIEIFYNRQRAQARLNYLSPAAFTQRFY